MNRVVQIFKVPLHSNFFNHEIFRLDAKTVKRIRGCVSDFILVDVYYAILSNGERSIREGVLLERANPRSTVSREASELQKTWWEDFTLDFMSGIHKP